MINHSGYANVFPRCPWRSTGGKRVAWRNLRKYFRVWRTHLGEILLVELMVAMDLSFLPRTPPFCHNSLPSKNAATPQITVRQPRYHARITPLFAAGLIPLQQHNTGRFAPANSLSQRSLSR